MSGIKGPKSKTCYQCKETKTTDKFARRGSKDLRSYRNICKECLNARIKGRGRSDEFRGHSGTMPGASYARMQTVQKVYDGDKWLELAEAGHLLNKISEERHR